jgi:hypothetical protein
MWKKINDTNKKNYMKEIFLEQQVKDFNNDELNEDELQLALKLSLEDQNSSESISNFIEDNEWEIIEECDYKDEAFCDDVAIAKLLQQKENDQYIQERERNIEQENIINSGSKIKVQSQYDNVFNKASSNIYNKSNVIQSSNRDAAEILSSQLLYATGNSKYIHLILYYNNLL